MLSSQHQQQLLLAQQNMNSASANDFENRRLRMLLNNKMMALGKEGLSNSVGDMVPTVGSPLQAACPVLPRGEADMLIKLKMAQLQQQQSHQQQLQQSALSCQQLQVPSYNLHSTEKIVAASTMTMDGSMQNSFRGNDQVNSVHASPGKVVCCHFSSDGKILASGGHDKKVVS